MPEQQPSFESKTVRAIRGREGRTVEKWQKDGWELVSQTAGSLQTELTFRRPKPKTSWRNIAILGGIVVVLSVALLIWQAFGSDDSTEAGHTAPSETSSAEPTTPSDQADVSSSTAPPVGEPDASETATQVLTVETSEELAQLLSGPSDGASVAAFAEAHAGDLIEFDGSIAAMAPHGSYATRYDLLIAVGDYSETESFGGPNFQFRNVNITFDLQLTGDVPDTIGVGDNVHIVARVVEYESDTLLFLLEPVETSVR